jgi:hypothetical protein
LPFVQAAVLLHELTGIRVSAATLRRQTEALGATAVALGEAEVVQLEETMPLPPPGPERLVLGADGAMVPLVGGEWAEVKLLTLGEPSPRRLAAETTPATSRAERLSYFARLTDAETFARQALGEVHRRGLETAGAVAAVQDGAPWLQGFVDFHRPDALRILDWPHAAQRLTSVAEQLFGEAAPRSQRAADRLRGWLWTQGPARVLAVLTAWESVAPSVAGDVAYLRERQAQVAYPAFRAQGWPVGSGATESGHKTVMQARLKRAGMHWARPHVNPLLALRLLECNGRWHSEGAGLLNAHRLRTMHLRCQRQQARRGARPPLSAPVPSPALSLPSAGAQPSPLRHPWRRYGTRLSGTN